MPVSLRAHHLLCMLTYLGKGYTPAFVSNYSKMIRRLNNGEPILLIEGPDDICQPMLDEKTCHCHNDSVRSRDLLARREIGRVLGNEISAGEEIRWGSRELMLLRRAFANGAIRGGCEGCEWHHLCSQIAQDSFKDCRLQLPPSAGG